MFQCFCAHVLVDFNQELVKASFYRHISKSLCDLCFSNYIEFDSRHKNVALFNPSWCDDLRFSWDMSKMWITYWIFWFSLSAVRLCRRHNTDWKEKRKTLENFMLYGVVIDVVKGNEKTKAEHPNSFRFLWERMWCENEEKGKPADNTVFF